MAMAQDTKLRAAVQQLMTVAGERALSSVVGKVGSAAERLTDYAQQGGGPGLMSAITGSVGKEGGGSGLMSAIKGSVGKESVKAALSGDKKKLLGAGIAGGKEMLKGAVGGKGKGKSGGKVTNIVEQVDVGVPIGLAYDQWTQFTEFPKFMKKVESVEQESAEKLKWRAQVLWSHRDWESTIVEQTPDRRIVWRSEGAKGYVDGAVTFHELAPELTRIVLVLEYHPQGFFEQTGNLWRAQGRRARLEIKHFARHVMTQSILHPEEIKGWRGEIHDGKVAEEGAASTEEDEGATAQEDEGATAQEPGQSAESTDEEPAAEEGTAGPESPQEAGSSREETPDRPRDSSTQPDEEPEEGEPVPSAAAKSRTEDSGGEEARPRSLRREPRKRLSRTGETTEE
jgi:uncharacterized membrane protein